MKTNKISEYVASVSAESRADMAADRWDEVMTDALYAAVDATTPDEMQEARGVASEIARQGTKTYRCTDGFVTKNHRGRQSHRCG